MSSIDIFAETNPAFCSLILFNFSVGYYHSALDGVPFPLLLIPLPIILSGDLSSSFDHTNQKTGFFRWLENNTDILVNLSNRIEDSFEFLKPTIEYSFGKKIFSLTQDGNFVPNLETVKKKYDEAIKLQMKHAERLGNWFGKVNSTKTIYNCLGLSI